ncbi:MAG: hypothetical protein O7G85_00065, partial [Planctomycetota bacterium]|nr:hypothetical protein [Planctomycetota bacterium]
FHDGDHLGVITRQMHGESTGQGLGNKQLAATMQYGNDLLQTLSTYHKGGLWHKDVKPENVIVHDGQAHLVDLGLVTPLRSAMTLTTHGTEYFRDPEMVRQALRGVKVHQVDGAKFDIYAVGAVLYFVLENTFPAHGGLSRFAKKSPESLRWIVKRAMTEYQQRYDSAEEMLADLRYAMQAADPYSVKPASLPSMSGGFVAIDEEEDKVEAVFAAHMPKPQYGPTPQAQPYVAAAAAAAPVSPETPSGPASRRPKLRVTSWWTGDYVVDDPGTGQATPANHPSGGKTEYRDFRAQAKAFRAEASEVRRKVRAGTINARKAAREQVKSARARAQAMRRKVTQRRFSHKANKKPTPFLAFIVMTVIVGGAILGAALVKNEQSYTSVSSYSSDSSGKRSALIVMDVPDRLDEDVLGQLEDIIEQYSHEYSLVVEELDVEQKYQDLVQKWYKRGQKGKTDRQLERWMKKDDLFGILHIEQDKHGRLTGMVLKSTASGADHRTRESNIDTLLPPITPMPGLLMDDAITHANTDKSILLVNDHPAKIDSRVERQIEAIIQAYREKGWNIVLQDEAEVVVRKELPIGPFRPETSSYEKLFSLMNELELGGILHVFAGPGTGEPHERVEHTFFRADHSEHDWDHSNNHDDHWDDSVSSSDDSR